MRLNVKKKPPSYEDWLQFFEEESQNQTQCLHDSNKKASEEIKKEEFLELISNHSLKEQSHNHVTFPQERSADHKENSKTSEKNDFRKPLLLISTILVMIIMNINSYPLITKCSIALSCLVLIGAAQFYTKQSKRLNSNIPKEIQNKEITSVQEIQNNYCQTPPNGYSTPPRGTNLET